MLWGLMHAVYQITGEITAPLKDKIYNALKMQKASIERNIIKRMGTFFWVTLAWIIFRAKDAAKGVAMIKSIFTVYNPWIFFNDSMFKLGLTWKECVVLLFAIVVLAVVEQKQENGICIRDWVLERHIVFRWFVYIAAICIICIFGSYGFGFNERDFIYGGF